MRWIAFVLLVIPVSAKNQILITGSVTDKENKHLSAASITISQIRSNTILSFSITDKYGKYQIIWQEQADSLKITASLLGYGKKELLIQAKSATIDFILEPKLIELPEVKVKSPPVWQRKDTINYDVSAFKQQQDRVIGDIIARLPGIEVTSGGQIKYNGKPINKYYIEGLDLLEDKYGIANNNLPADAVEKIQVLENHQPIRVLDSLAFSDRAALNIKLKNTAKMKLVGRGRIGIGASPLLTENELMAMLFKKKHQFINTYKFNNTGIDITKELTAQNISSYINALQNGSVKNDLVSVVSPAPPPIAQRRYLLNNNHTLSVNQLFALNKIYQLRINAAFTNDYQKQLSRVNSTIFLPSDTVTITEENKSRINLNLLQSDITLMANTPAYYLKNTFSFKGWWQNEQSTILNAQQINQHVKNPFFNFFNDFNLLKTKNKKVVELNSYAGYTRLPQNLSVNPGLYPGILNNNIFYQQTIQNATLSTFFTENYFSVRTRISRWGIQFKNGLNIQNRKFSSNLLLQENGILKEPADSFQNNLHWNRARVFTEGSASYESNKIRFQISVPLNFTAIHYSDNPKLLEEKRSSLFFNPSMSLMFQLSPKWTLNSSIGYTEDFGGIEGVTNGYILKTYRNLSNNNAPLANTSSLNASLSATFRNPVKVLFFNAGLLYNKTLSNLLYYQQFNGQLETLLAFLQTNHTDRISLFSRFNKYIIDLKTSFTLSANYSAGKQQQVQQNRLVTFNNQNLNLGVVINSKIAELITAEYSLNGLYFLSGTQLQNEKTRVTNGKQQLIINYFPVKTVTVRASLEHYMLNAGAFDKREYFFADAGLRIKPKKSTVDYEIGIQNILNTKNFTSAILNNNIQIFSFFQIRPFQIIAKVGFSF
jgi:hypothetical protein